MNEIAITVKNLSKRYRLGERIPYKALRDVLTNFITVPFKRVKDSSKKGDGYIWALKDISLEIKKGEVVGIIGGNGAGKTTLLKILSKITRPTKGYAQVYGRVGSLLDVGTGFHPELSGRENIFLNGALLGMKKKEIEKKFYEIVAFSEIEKFIDTPVKHYSSGMYMRLAFSVAAHLEPDTLLVDEVLSVGDAAFQKKCLGKIDDVAKQGRTVLFVSHNMAAINRLCVQAIWLHEGSLRMAGQTEDVVSAYLSFGAKMEGERQWLKPEEAPGNETIRLRAVRLRNEVNSIVSSVDVRMPLFIEIEYEVLSQVSGLQVGFWLLTQDGTTVFVAGDNEDPLWLGKPRQPGIYKSVCKIPALLLNSGTYSISVASDINNMELMFVKENLIHFFVEQTHLPAHSHTRPAGVISPFLEWRVSKLE